MGTSRAMVATLLALASGCGYTSKYEAPRDGRARAIWRDSDVVLELSGAPLSEACAGELRAASSTGRLRLAPGEVPQGGEGGYWRPRYYGAPIVVVRSGIAPPLLRPPLFFPSPAIASAAGHASPSIGGGGSVGGLGSGDSGKVLAVVAVIALVVLPIVDVWLALDEPESDRSSQAIDQVNAFNDLSRLAGSPCAWQIEAGEAP